MIKGHSVSPLIMVCFNILIGDLVENVKHVTLQGMEITYVGVKMDPFQFFSQFLPFNAESIFLSFSSSVKF